MRINLNKEKQIVKQSISIIAKYTKKSMTFMLKILKKIWAWYVGLWRKFPKDMTYITIIIVMLLLLLIRPANAQRLSDTTNTPNATQTQSESVSEATAIQALNTYLKDTPMAGTGKIQIDTIKKYDLGWENRYLLSAMAKHETDLSRLGDGASEEAKGRHNAWGLGVHYDWGWATWEEAIDKLGYTLRRYYAWSNFEPCKIEDVWAPPGENSAGYEWCAGVNRAGADIVKIENSLK